MHTMHVLSGRPVQPSSSAASSRGRGRRAFAPGRTLFLTFALVVAAFVLATLVTVLWLERASSSTEDISSNAMPSIVELAAMRARAHELEVELERSLVRGDSDVPRLAETIASIDALSSSYRAHSAFGAERGLWASASSAIDDAVRAAEKGRAALVAGDVDLARATMDEELRPSTTRADTELWRLVDFNAKEGQRRAEFIQRNRARAIEAAIAFDGASVALAAMLALVAYRAFRHYTRLIEERSDELEQFAARVAHDLRGPMSPVLLALLRAQQRTPADDALARVLQLGTSSLKRMTALVDDLLAFALAGGHPDANARASLRRAVDGILEEAAPAADAASVELRVEPFVDAWVACSQGVLGSLLSNLVRNAIKYMDGAAVRHVTVRVAARSSAVRVEVLDTGPGLPPGTAPHVFEPYVRADRTGQPGLGLGLATVKRLAEAHGGRVGVRSTEHGCTFWFELPLAAEGA